MELFNKVYIFVVKYTEKSAQNTAYSMFERNTYESIGPYQSIGPKKLNLDPIEFCPEYDKHLSEIRAQIK